MSAEMQINHCSLKYRCVGDMCDMAGQLQNPDDDGGSTGGGGVMESSASASGSVTGEMPSAFGLFTYEMEDEVNNKQQQPPSASSVKVTTTMATKQAAW